MTPRVLKKWSRAAAEILVKHYGVKPFLAERGQNYHGFDIRCKCPWPKRSPYRICQHIHPLPGTPMTGEMSGYYEPEWSERTAYEDLHERVLWMDRPVGITDEEWARIMAVAQVNVDDQTGIKEWIKSSIDAWERTAA